MKSHQIGIEILESRIAPAALPLPGLPTIKNAQWLSTNAGQPTASGQTYFELSAGQGLSTDGDKSGTYLLFVEKGNCLVFATDMDYSGSIDPDEITGIAAGDGLRMISFVDIHGDIVTNLKETYITGPGGVKKLVPKLTDSDNNPANDTEVNGNLDGDGRIVLNNTIEKIEFRALTIADLPDQNGDTVVTDGDVLARQAYTTFSLYGNIYAGRGFGVIGDPTSGLFVDQTGELTINGYANHPMVNGIKVGSAVGGEYFSFGVSNRNDIQGVLLSFNAPTGQTGAHIAGVHAAQGTELNINYLIAGKGGVGAPGGSIRDVQLATDGVGGYMIVAGNGGDGPTGGAGGAIINFGDSGSITGKVLIKSGDGGTGTTGGGGNANNSLLGPLNLRGNVGLELGDGGSGFTSGGNGASITAGVITAKDEIFTGGAEAVGTTHYPSGASGTYTPRIGTQSLLDFNNDGIGDFVFTSTTPSQVVVRLGSAGGFVGTYDNPYGDLTDRAIFLPGFLNSDALTVGDFNGDGHADIAVASTEHTGRSGGIVIYLAKYEDANFDGTVSGSENVILDNPGDTYDQQNDFLGFSDGIFSYVAFPFSQINKLAAGDFDGDGKVEIAVQGTDISAVTNQYFAILTADVDGQNQRQTGQFFLDLGLYEAPSKIPYALLKEEADGGTVDMQVTALSTTSLRDSLVFIERRGNAGTAPVTYTFNGTGFATQTWTMGQVDVNRNTGPNDITLVDYNILHFTIGDFDGDNRADLALLSAQPVNFITVLTGTGNGGGAPDTGTGQNAGVFFDIQPQMVHITSGDFDGDGVVDDVAVSRNDENVFVHNYNAVPVIGTLGTIRSFKPGNGAGESFPFTNYISSVTNNIATSHVVIGLGNGAAPKNLGGEAMFIEGRGSFQYQIDRYDLKAGDGGNSFAGRGGNGGSIGGALSLQTITDQVTGVATPSLVGALNFNLDLSVTLIAGNGGDGFSSGGNGGNITGVTIIQTVPDYAPPPPEENWSPSFLFAGDGGRGVSGAGGNGGNIASVMIDEGEIFQAGNGGVGKVGGNGGSVIGNGRAGFFDFARLQHALLPIVGFYDTAAFSLSVTAGLGGDGTKRGGNGGDIRNFAAGMLGFEQLYYAGSGGNAVSGPGGNGGSILNSSPLSQNLSGGFGSDIVLQAGDGGNGTSGGHGGSVRNFVHNVSLDFAASILSIVGGHGGNGISGPGGNGGAVTGIEVAANGVVGTFTPYQFNRILAGNGGSSSASRGGNGGEIASVVTGAGASGFAVVAGAGGDGLFNGGNGGGITNLKLSGGGGELSNFLVAAGAGGDASSFLPNPLEATTNPNQDKKAFGGKIGVGGNGGSINGVKSDAQALAHFNLIAGNGGDTLTYGTAGDPKAYVGRGGSVIGINIDGDIGNVTGDDASTPGVNEAVEVKSYNNLLGGESFKEWALANLYSETPGDVFLDDSDGNVGVVVGVAGRNKAIALPSNPADFRSQPATGGKTGDMINVVAKNLLAAVAGSVDRIAAINMVKGLFVTSGFIGAEKNEFGSDPAVDPNYLDENGVGTPSPYEPALEGRLVDGALIAHIIVNSAGQPVSLPGYVFKR